MTLVLLITDYFQRKERTGLDRYADEIVRRVPRLVPDWQFTLLSFGEPTQQLDWFAPNVRHVGLPASRRKMLLSGLTRGVSTLGNPLREVLRQADLVHTLLPLPVDAAGKPFLTTVHDMIMLLYPDTYPRHVPLTTRLIYRDLKRQQSARYVTVSETTANDLCRLVSVEKSRVRWVYNGVDERFVPAHADAIAAARAKYGLPERYFLFIGSMHPRKNLPLLMQAHQQFARQDTSETKLVIGGRMSLGGEELKRQIAELGVEQSVLLPGYIAEADLSAVISGALALCYPSLYEGFGLPALEAMACGTPVIASRGGSIPEVMPPNGLLCDAGDAACFAAAMQRITQDAALRAQLVADGLQWVQRFSWHNTAAGTLALYRELLGLPG